MRHARIIVAALLLVAGHALAQGSATGRQVVSDLSELRVKPRGAATSGALADHLAGWVSVKTYGAKGDGVTDDTAALNAARDAAAAGLTLYLPPGIYRTSGLVLKSGMSIRGATWTSNGSGYYLSAPSTASVLKATSNTVNVLEVDGDANGYSLTTEISYLGILGPNGNGGAAVATGNAAQGNGIYIHGSAATVGNSGVHVHHVTVGGMGGKGIYAPLLWHSKIGPFVHVDNCGDNLFEVQGGNTTTFDTTYAHRVASGKAGYRVYGNATFTAANGIDASTSANWGVFGKSLALGDDVNYDSSITLINSNVEDFTNYGVWFRGTGGLHVIGTTFWAPATGTVTAIRFDGQPRKGNILDSTSTIGTKGATWANGGYAIAAPNTPFIAMGDAGAITGQTFARSYWNTGAFSASMPGIWANASTGALHASPFALGDTGSRVIQWNHNNIAWTPGLIAAGSFASVNITSFPQLAGVNPAAGKYVTQGAFSLDAGTALPDGLLVTGVPTAANTVRVTIYNASGSPQTLGAGKAVALVSIVN